VDEPSFEPWLRQAVRVRPSAGGCRYLVRVRFEPCTCCSTGTRVVSTWVCELGNAEAVAWCSHCFNATCDPVPADDDLHARLAVARAAADHSVLWSAARPALEDLERRGLL
jgi:hypothetical protein